VKKLLLCFFIFCAITHVYGRRPVLSFSPSRISADTLAFNFRYSGNFIFKSRSAATWLNVGGCDTVRISHVYKYDESGAKSEVRKNKVNAIPDYCLPGMAYEVFFEVNYPKEIRFVMYTEDNDSVVLFVTGSGIMPMKISALNELSAPAVQGQLSTTDIVITNTSGSVRVLDSVVIPDGKWSCSNKFPITLQPRSSATLQVHTTFADHASVYASGFVAVFHHLRGTLIRDMSSCYVAAKFTHGVMITGATQKDFGLVKDGDTLRTQVKVINNGSTVVSLATMPNYGISSVSKNRLVQGDTATLWIYWKVTMATGNFLFNQPLFRDYSNGHCTFTFKGTTNQKDKGAYKYVNPDSLVFVETTHFDFGEVPVLQERAQHSFKCRNNASVPILVVNCVTGDGGSMAWSTREPIQPGEEFTITFVQDLKGGRMQFNRTVTATIQVGEITLQKLINCRGVIVYD
jgi:hypothetical protein